MQLAVGRCVGLTTDLAGAHVDIAEEHSSGDDGRATLAAGQRQRERTLETAGHLSRSPHQSHAVAGCLWACGCGGVAVGLQRDRPLPAAVGGGGVGGAGEAGGGSEGDLLVRGGGAVEGGGGRREQVGGGLQDPARQRQTGGEESAA